MSQRPVQVQNTEASYKIVGYNFEHCPLCRTVNSAHDRTVLADMCGEQLQDLTEKRLVRCKSEQRHILGAAAELCHGQNAFTSPQQAVEERGPSQPSALIIQSTPTQTPDRRVGEDIYTCICPCHCWNWALLLFTNTSYRKSLNFTFVLNIPASTVNSFVCNLLRPPYTLSQLVYTTVNVFVSFIKE